MFGLLPLFSLLFLFLFLMKKNCTRDWREVYAWTAVIGGVCVVVSVEVLSLFHSISPVIIRCFWGVTLLITLILFIKIFTIAGISWGTLRSWQWFEWMGLVLIGVILLGTLVGAVMAPPNNWDSMTYHLPRVMQWAANGSVQHFSTHIPRQIFNNPGAEVFLLHIYLLFGDDRCFNLLQWGAFLGCILLSSWITHLLGIGRWGQIFAAVFVALIPMAVLQATSTQNDLVFSFWVLACVGLGCSAIREFRSVNLLMAAAALGLAALTKTSVFVLIPFLVWFGIGSWIRYKKMLLVVVGIALLVCGPHYVRNWALLEGKSFIHEEGAALIMQKHDVLSVASNGLRQMASELRTLWGPANDCIVRGIRFWHSLSGVKIDDSAIFTDSLEVINTAPLVMDEDFSGNTIQVLLIIFLLGVLVLLRPEKKVWIYLICVCCSALLFWLLLKWQPWVTRLHLPVMILFAPLMGLSAYRWRWLLLGCSVIFFIFALWAMAFNATRPLGGKFNVFGPKAPVAFAKNRYLIPYYSVAAMLLSKVACKDVGLIENADSWEYPLWSMTHGSGIRFRSVDVTNVSAKLEEAVLPCAIVTIDQSSDPQLRVAKGMPFVRIWGAEKIMAVYVRLQPEMLK